MCLQFSKVGHANTQIEYDAERIVMVSEAIQAYAAKNGKYPEGANWQIIHELAHPQRGVGLKAKGRDSVGNLLDLNGHPYLFFFTSEGCVLIATLAKNGTAIERYVLLPAFTGIIRVPAARDVPAKADTPPASSSSR